MLGPQVSTECSTPVGLSSLSVPLLVRLLCSACPPRVAPTALLRLTLSSRPAALVCCVRSLRRRRQRAAAGYFTNSCCNCANAACTDAACADAAPLLLPAADLKSAVVLLRRRHPARAQRQRHRLEQAVPDGGTDAAGVCLSMPTPAYDLNPDRCSYCSCCSSCSSCS